MSQSKETARARVAPRKESGSSAGNPAHEEAPSVLACALIGPKGSGKTAFVASLGRAGIFSSLEEIRVVPTGRASWLTEEALDNFRNGRTLVNPSSSKKSYAFMVSDRATQRRRSPYGQLALRDLPSRSLFSSEPRSHESTAMQRFDFEAAHTSQALILFFDALKPRREDWQTALIRILDELSVSNSASGRDRGSEDSRAHRSGFRLPRKRILILLSRVDLLCTDILQRGKAQGSLFLKGLTPGRLALRLDPLAQAVERLGLKLLRTFLTVLGTKGEVAVALTSSGGFDPETGLSVLDADGRPNNLSNGRGRSPSLDLWSPCGLLESIEWLLTGRAGAAIELVHAKALREISDEIAAALRRETRGGLL